MMNLLQLKMIVPRGSHCELKKGIDTICSSEDLKELVKRKDSTPIVFKTRNPGL